MSLLFYLEVASSSVGAITLDIGISGLISGPNPKQACAEKRSRAMDTHTVVASYDLIDSSGRVIQADRGLLQFMFSSRAGRIKMELGESNTWATIRWRVRARLVKRESN